MNNKQKEVLKILVKKEIEHLKTDKDSLLISNSPFLNKETLDGSDLEFLKSEELYLNFLENLLKDL